MTVTVPEGRSGNAEIRRVIADETTYGDIFQAMQHGRPIVPPGSSITCLYLAGRLWMSDTPAERRDHMPAIIKAGQLSARRALVNGLGIGMIVAGLLDVPTIEHIDVVEIDKDVINLVGGHVERLAADAGKTVNIHHDDAYTIAWPAGTVWDIAWSDIWESACTDNLLDMSRLSRRYSRRVRWHGHWLRDMLLTQRTANTRADRQRAAWFDGRSDAPLWTTT